MHLYGNSTLLLIMPVSHPAAAVGITAGATSEGLLFPLASIATPVRVARRLWQMGSKAPASPGAGSTSF